MCNIRMRECIARCQAEEEAQPEEEAASTQENYISSYCKQKKIQKDNKAAAASLNLQRT